MNAQIDDVFDKEYGSPSTDSLSTKKDEEFATYEGPSSKEDEKEQEAYVTGKPRRNIIRAKITYDD